MSRVHYQTRIGRLDDWPAHDKEVRPAEEESMEEVGFHVIGEAPAWMAGFRVCPRRFFERAHRLTVGFCQPGRVVWACLMPVMTVGLAPLAGLRGMADRSTNIPSRMA